MATCRSDVKEKLPAVEEAKGFAPARRTESLLSRQKSTDGTRGITK